MFSVTSSISTCDCLHFEWVSVRLQVTEAQQQWWNFKAANFDSVLLFKVGKFYEVGGGSAAAAAATTQQAVQLKLVGWLDSWLVYSDVTTCHDSGVHHRAGHVLRPNPSTRFALLLLCFC